MKSFSAIFTLVLLMVFTSSSIAQTGWAKYEGNPVLDPGASGTWDDGFIALSKVIYDGDKYHIWYGGGRGQTFKSIGYATSPDGITWTKYDDPTTINGLYAESDPVLVPGQQGDWDDAVVSCPYVLLLDSTYHMWFGGSTDSELYSASIGYATSTDGISWQKDTLNNPVLTKGPNGAWDDAWVFKPFVLYIDNNFHMWYDAWNGLNEQVRFGHATSLNGVTWTRDSNNPVLSFGSSRSWDYPRIDGPSVIYDGQTFHMWYTGGDFFTWQIGYATSSDGSEWTKYIGNPVLTYGAAGSWDAKAIGFCSVIFDTATSTYKMWYTGGNGEWDGHIGYATAPAIINVPGKFETIQAAIDAASDGNVILVDEGTYFENINFKGKAITVASHYFIDGDTTHRNNTIIDGSEPSNPDSGSVVFLESGEDTTSVLMGFTITNGTGTKTQYTYEGTIYDARAGGGILCMNSGGRFVANKIINNSITDENTTIGGGFAAGDYGSEAYVILESNQITNNTMHSGNNATGGGITLACNGKIVNNDISYNSCIAAGNAASGGGVRTTTVSQYPRTVFLEGNTITHNFVRGKGTESPYFWAALGGGITNTGSKVLILNNDISYNQLDETETGTGSGGGIYMYLANSASVVSGNKFFHNKIDMAMTNYGGGMSLASCTLSVTNNIFAKNSARYGGGIYLTHNNSAIINNTIVNNTGVSRGGGLYSEVGNPVVINTILWDNNAPSNPQISGNAEVRYSDIQGGRAGEGNKDVDPLFAPGDSLYHLMGTTDTSQCLNTGIDSIKIGNKFYYAPKTDHGGYIRPQPAGSMPDMGAWESRVVNSIELMGNRSIANTFALYQNYPNPFNPTTNIEFRISKSEFVTLTIYNVKGQVVKRPIGQRINAGVHHYQFDGTDLASSVYYYQLIAGEFQDVKKMILLK